MRNDTKYFYETGDFPWVQALEKNWEIIRDELLAIINEPAEFLPNENWIAAHPHYVKNEEKKIAWKTFDFIFWGIKYFNHCERCPRTAELLKSVPELISAEFSVLEPHTHILPHKGYSKMILRCHLGLLIPDKVNCAIRVMDTTKNWEEGRMMIFDDSVEHEAWNKSDKPRAVLMFDIPNPAMNYTAAEICRYKLENINDPYLLNVADKKTWLKWFEQGYFSRE